jgi:2-dehydropantoate 2-reductase
MLNSVKDVLEQICPVTIEPNFTGARWSKLLINAAFSGVSAVTGYSFGEVARGRRSRDCALHIVRECIAVCRAMCISIEPLVGKYPADFLYFDSPLKKALLSLVMRVAMGGHSEIKSGMLKDIDRGRASDIDFINGAVSRAGRENGVPTPCNDRIVELVHSIERGERRYGAHNLELVGG